MKTPQVESRWALLVLLSVTAIAAADPQPESKPPDKSQEKPYELTFHVVSTDQKPVAGARIVPWAVGAGPGSFGFRENLFAPIVTDAEGTARVIFPTDRKDPQVERLLRAVKGGLRSIALRVDHPEHPMWSAYLNIGGDHRVTLSEAATVEIRAHRRNESGMLQRLVPVVSQSFYSGSDWSEKDGVLTIRRVEMNSAKATRWLRVVHVPEKGPVWFSNLLDLRFKVKQVRLNLAMQPSVRLEGSLDPHVPRPVKGGRVVAQVIHGSDVWTNWTWGATAEIAPDGTFVLESLPPDEDLQLIALCDGWVSNSPTTDEVQAYAAKHGLSQLQYTGPVSHFVYPNLYRLEGSILRPIVSMNPTADCEVTVIDDAGRPLPDATVSFWPNQIFFMSGSNIVGTGFDAMKMLRSQIGGRKDKPDVDWRRFSKDYAAKTNERGIALIHNLPVPGAGGRERATEAMFSASHETYASTASLFPAPHANVSLVSGKTGHVTVRLHRKTAQLETIPAAGKRP
jgi:hypothetical protein